MSEVTEQQLEDMEALFVQTAASMTSDRGTITLRGLSPSTLYFADRPQREVGHMLSRQFVANWAAGDNSFADNPPNAVLSFAEPGDRLPEDAVVVIDDPHLDGDALTYRIKVLDGSVPAATGPCALFIDPLGRPLSPVSVAGCTGVRFAGGAEGPKAGRRLAVIRGSVPLLKPGSRMSYALAVDLGAPVTAAFAAARSSDGACGTIRPALA
jgi:hypothetical protein